jgi:MoxR-like ATPase
MANIDFSEFDGLFGDIETPTQDTAKAVEAAPAIAAPIEAEPIGIQIENVNAPINPAMLQSAQAKMQQIYVEMNNLFVERDELIKIMQLAIATGTNLLMLGPPGTAKSAITYELCGRIENANYFQWMLNKTSDPSEVFGPFSVKEMENDKFMRITTGKLPEAHIAFMDEVFKSNAPTLNALLTIMNEHIFYNDGKPQPVPLISMFGASNEPPEDETLDAMYDRFIFRMNVQYIHDAANKKRMHSNYIDDRAGLLGLVNKTTISLAELQMLQQAAKAVRVPKDIINKFIRLINDLDRQAIHVSDRRQNECFKIMQGSAVLRGSNVVGLDDFKSLIYVLWEKEEHIPMIESAILKMVNPYDDRFKELKENFNQVKTDIDGITDSSQKSKKAIESKGVIEKIVGKVNKLINEASKNGKDTTEFTDFRDMMIQYNQQLISSALGATFGGFGLGEEDNPFA